MRNKRPIQINQGYIKKYKIDITNYHLIKIKCSCGARKHKCILEYENDARGMTLDDISALYGCKDCDHGEDITLSLLDDPKNIEK